MEALGRQWIADDTIVVFTSDHGDLVVRTAGSCRSGSTLYDECNSRPACWSRAAAWTGSRRCFTADEPRRPHPDSARLGRHRPRAGDRRRLAHHEEAQELPGRDLSDVVTGRARADSVAAPVYFMTEDNPSKGSSRVNILTGTPFEAVGGPSNIESVVATLPTGPGGAEELWKLNHYYERLDAWNDDHGIPKNPFAYPRPNPSSSCTT